MIIWNFFNRCKEVAIKHRLNRYDTDNRNFLLGAVGMRKDGVIVSAANGPVLMYNINHSYFAKAHAEFRLSRKLDKGSTVFVARVSPTTNKFMNSRPCPTCQNAMRKKGVKKVYYTISDNEYGCIFL